MNNKDREIAHLVSQLVECDFTKLDLFRVEFLDSVSQYLGFFFYSAGIDIDTEISLEIETKYVPGSNAFDPKRFYKKEVSKRLSYFRDLSKKVGPKVVHFYCMKSYRDWP